MLKSLNATVKGLITGAVMVLVSLLVLQTTKTINSPYQYAVYTTYVAGVLWTLLSFRSTGSHSFKEYFSEGFKCFIVVTLIMVVYTFIFHRVNTQFRDDYLSMMQVDMEKSHDKTPAEIKDIIASTKSNFGNVLTAGSVFIYLVIGALVSAIGSGFLSQKKTA